MKNAEKTGRTGTVLRRMGASAVVLATVLGLSAAVDQVLSPAPIGAATQTPQAVFASATADLASQAKLLASTNGTKLLDLAAVLERQSAALAPAGPQPSGTRSATPAAGTGTGAATAAPGLPRLVEDVRASITDLLEQARREPDGGLARLYTAAALGRLDVLRPLLPSGGPSVTDLLKPAPPAPSVSCSSGLPSPAGTASAAPTTASTAPATNGAPSGPASSAAGLPTVSPEAAAATQAVLRAGRHLAYLYQVAEVRLDRDARAEADRFETAVRSSSAEATAWLRAACATPPVPEAGYELPATFLTSPVSGLGSVEEERANAALDLVAVSTGDLRTWAMTQYLESGARARQWTPTIGSGQALPGIADAATPSPSLSPVPSGTPSAGSR